MSNNLRGFWKDDIDTKKSESFISRAEKKLLPKTTMTRKERRRKKKAKNSGDPYTKGDCFYKSKEWRKLRYRVLRKYSAECMCCGRSKKEHGIVIHVDHIKPKSKHPHLALDFENLQLLCEDCNIGKLNIDETDWRPDEIDAELEILAEAINRI